MIILVTYCLKSPKSRRFFQPVLLLHPARLLDRLERPVYHVRYALLYNGHLIISTYTKNRILKKKMTEYKMID